MEPRRLTLVASAPIVPHGAGIPILEELVEILETDIQALQIRLSRTREPSLDGFLVRQLARKQDELDVILSFSKSS